MKKGFKSALVILFSLMTGVIHSQTVSPGPVAMGAMFNKESTSVDYTTGIMNYNIPLLQLLQDGIELPISLNYRASGIKVEDKSSVAGWGWYLSQGVGMISRQIRGGFADEHFLLGILNNPVVLSGPSAAANQRLVQQGNLDSESDIFSVNILGESLRFILRKDLGKLVAVPLVRSDLNITIVADPTLTLIKSFIVTDLSGVVYTFEANNSSKFLNLNPGGGDDRAENSILSWFLTQISKPDNGDILFEYGGNHYEEQISPNESYVHFGLAKTVPSMKDEGLRQALQDLESSYSYMASIIQSIETTQMLLSTVQKPAITTVGEFFGITPSRDYNKFLREAYERGLEDLSRSYNTQAQTVNDNSSEVTYLLNQMYNTNRVEHYEMQSSQQRSLYSNRLLSRILTRKEILEFEYREHIGSSVSSFEIASIRHKNIDGKLLKTIIFDIDKESFLRKVQVITPTQKVLQEYEFDYYNPSKYLINTAQDYWGYYNGKDDNVTLFSNDPTARVFAENSVAYIPLFNKDGISALSSYFTDLTDQELSLGDRKIVTSQSVARTLKNVKTLFGSTLSFEYESNEIYSSTISKNATVGGIRIKKITKSDGNNTSFTRYQYKFPVPGNTSVEKSTGRYMEWDKKYFAYPYSYGSYVDGHMFSNYVNVSGVPEDNSNNGVLYHYVEEIREDGAATGYKFPAAESGINNAPYVSYLDKLLLAKIDYNASGKIVCIQRNRYVTNITALGNRAVEMQALAQKFSYLQTGSFAGPSTFEQLKKLPVSYNEVSLLSNYPNQPSSRISFGGKSYSVNLYSQIYLPHYQPRLSPVAPPSNYLLVAGNMFLLKETETSIYNIDYDINAGYSVSNAPALPDEKAYLYERLLNATTIIPIKTVTSYGYDNPAHIMITQRKTVASDGKINLHKYKYAIDYQLEAGSPVMLLQDRKQLNPLIEEQMWSSTDGGTSYRLISAKLNEYDTKQINTHVFLYPRKEYLLETSLPVTTSLQAYNSTAPYTALFWENNTLYKAPLRTNSLDIGFGFSRLAGSLDRLNKPLNAVKYDPLNGNLLVEAGFTKSENMFAIDFSPYQEHFYYRQFNMFTGYSSGISLRTKKNYSTRPFTNGFYMSTATFDHQYYVTPISLAFDDFEKNYPAEFGNIQFSPVFDAVYSLIKTIKNRSNKKDFTEAYWSYLQALGSYRPLTTSPLNEFETEMLTLSSYGIDYMEIKRYLLNLFLSFDASLDDYQTIVLNNGYENTVGMDQIDRQNLTFKVAVDNLIAKNVNLAGYLTLVDYTASTGDGLLNLFYKIIYKNGTVSSPLTATFYSFKGKLFKTQIALSALPNSQDIASLEFVVSNSSGKGLIIVLPENVPFKATAFLPNHLPFVSFNENGQYAETFYDDEGHRRFVKDYQGHVALVESQVLNRSALSVEPKMVDVRLSNYFVPGTDPELQIIEILAYSNVPGGGVIRYSDNIILPGKTSVIQIPEGSWDIVVKINGSQGKVFWGSTALVLDQFSKAAINHTTLVQGNTYSFSLRPLTP